MNSIIKLIQIIICISTVLTQMQIRQKQNQRKVNEFKKRRIYDC